MADRRNRNSEENLRNTGSAEAQGAVSVSANETTSSIESTKDVYVGAVIEINQKRVNLIPSTPINKIDQYGLKLSLAEPLELGRLQDAMGSICKDIGIENPLDARKLEDISVPILKNVAKKVADANMRIEGLEYEQPPKKRTADNSLVETPSKYVFVASVNWNKQYQLQFILLSDGTSLPEEGNQKIVIGKSGESIQLRIFDSEGRLEDLTEENLTPDQRPRFQSFKELLKDKDEYWAQASRPDEKARESIIDAATSIKEGVEFFKLQGLIFGVSSGYTSEGGENLEVQKAFKSALNAMTKESGNGRLLPGSSETQSLGQGSDTPPEDDRG